MEQTQEITIQINPSQQGTYFTIPVSIPENIERLDIKYSYPRRDAILTDIDSGSFDGHPSRNIIDLGLIGPDGRQVGASGSDKNEISVSETTATPGYNACAIVPGTWQILVGAYKVAAEGVTVTYEVTYINKARRLLKGDLHTHTLASDGVHTLEELAWKARRNGLDFVAVTDHNQFVSKFALPQITGVTMIPGVEWTHYQGHANFLGVDEPYEEPFYTNTDVETQQRFDSARQRGATIIINHPLDDTCPFRFDLNSLPHDAIEIWNGPMRESNLRAVGLWQLMLVKGRKIPMCGGSDYHRDTPFIFLGGPTMCVYSEGSGPSDILSAIRAGHGFVSFAPNGPTLELLAGDAIMGDSVLWGDMKTLQIQAHNLDAGDVLRLVTATSSEILFTAPTFGNVNLKYEMPEPGFARVEILRAFLPGLPMLPALISNPIYFDAD